MTEIKWSLLICLLTLWVLTFLLRRDRFSFGLPFAYLFALLLIHVPGAIAHGFKDVSADENSVLTDSYYTELGIRCAAIGVVAYLFGVWAARWQRVKTPPPVECNRASFWWFCLGAGWFVTYGLSFLGQVPSIGAAVEKGGAVWMLGTLLGLRDAVK